MTFFLFVLFWVLLLLVFISNAVTPKAISSIFASSLALIYIVIAIVLTIASFIRLDHELIFIIPQLALYGFIFAHVSEAGRFPRMWNDRSDYRECPNGNSRVSPTNEGEFKPRNKGWGRDW